MAETKEFKDCRFCGSAPMDLRPQTWAVVCRTPGCPLYDIATDCDVWQKPSPEVATLQAEVDRLKEEIKLLYLACSSYDEMARNMASRFVSGGTLAVVTKVFDKAASMVAAIKAGG